MRLSRTLRLRLYNSHDGHHHFFSRHPLSGTKSVAKSRHSQSFQEHAMLNWAARYYPIIRILKTHGLFENASLLEIGSGPIGIGRFRKVPFVGCDIEFPIPPVWPMTPLVTSAAQLPMNDHAFDVVVASDVLEHVPPQLRGSVICESLRVARKLVIFGFPCGQLAWDSDKALLDTYAGAELPPPGWLVEHMETTFPGAELFRRLDGWDIRQVGNENLRFHSWLMRREMSTKFVRASSIALRAMPFLVQALLRLADHPPFYRQIFVLERQRSPSSMTERPAESIHSSSLQV